MRSIALALSLVFLAPTVAEAVSKRDRTRAKRFARRAARSFKLKRYKQALRDFERAYDLVELPALRYNIGQCHLLLGHYDDAIASFERFLQESPDTPYAKDVRALIAEAEAELERRSPKPDVPIVEEEPAIAVLDDPPPPVVPPPPPPLVTAPPPPAPPVAEPGDDDGFPMWVVWAIVGGVAVAGGTAAIVAAQPDTTTVLPMGDLGVIDRRGPR